MAAGTPRSNLSGNQILQKVYDDPTDSLKVKANIVTNIEGDVEVAIDSVHDSVTLGDTSGNLVTTTTVGSQVGVDISLLGLPSFQTSQYIIGLSSSQLTPSPLTNRSGISIKSSLNNIGIVYIGNTSGVTTSTGFFLSPGDAISLDLTAAHQIWCIASIVGQSVAVLEIGG